MMSPVFRETMISETMISMTKKVTAGCCVDDRCDDQTCSVLPEGATCTDCVHVYRCVMIFGVQPENVICDFYPLKFRASWPESGKRDDG